MGLEKGVLTEAIKGMNNGGWGGFMAKASASPWTSVIGSAADTIGGFLPEKTEYSGDKGAITKGMDAAYDKISDAIANVPVFGTAASAIMKGNKLLGLGINAIGGGTDGMTTQDAILGSAFLTPMGWINGAFGKNTDTIKLDNQTQLVVGSSYGGTYLDINKAVQHSGKKYGLLSRGAMREQDALIHDAGRKLNLMNTMASNVSMSTDVISNQTDIAANAYSLQLNGGYELSSVRAAKQGDKLFSKEQRLRTTMILAKKKLGGNIEFTPFIFNLDSLNSIKFQEGGSIKTLKGIKKTVDPEGLYYIGDIWKHLGINDDDQLLYKATSVNDLINILNLNGSIHDHMNNTNTSYYDVYNEFKNNNKDWESWDDDTFKLNFINHIGKNLMKKASDYYTSVNSFKQGGSIIPEGALHAHKHHLEEINPDLKGQITSKGIPVIIEKEGGEVEQLAEIEHSEIIFLKSITEQIENAYKLYYSNDISEEEKDKLAIEIGKLLANEILYNTDDRTDLIKTIK